VSQVVESRRHPLDLLREHLSNMCSKEVKAGEVRIDFTHDPKFGPTFIFTDDGIGMNHTGNMKTPGRLDKFLAVAYSGHAGVQTDEFGQKGIGAKLSMNCRRLEIRTTSRETGQSFYVYVDHPLETLRKGQQPKFQIYDGGGPEDGGTASEGIDMLANFRIRQDGDTQQIVPVEVDYTFENFFDHGHNPNQTGAIICWSVEDTENPSLEQSDLHYLMFYKSTDKKIPILIMSRFTTIEGRTRQNLKK